VARFVHVWFQCLHVRRLHFKGVDFLPGVALVFDLQCGK